MSRICGFLGIAFLIVDLAIIGMPGTPGFDTSHLILESTIHEFSSLVTIASALGNMAAAGFLQLGLKLVAYGLIRFAIPLAPTAAQESHWSLAGLCVIGILYRTLVALNQTNLRRMLLHKPCRSGGAMYCCF
jgi:NADH:ubiquinone oxidoreductase subunit 4 (subunit M)